MFFKDHNLSSIKSIVSLINHNQNIRTKIQLKKLETIASVSGEILKFDIGVNKEKKYVI